MSDNSLIFYHSPQTRSSGVLFLLEELGVPYEMKVLNRHRGENLQPEYLAINPLGKIPALIHNGTVVTEQVACYLHLADRFREKELAPTLDEPIRGAYVRWMIYYGSTFEPAIIDRALKREPGDWRQLAYGDFQSMRKTLFEQITSGGPYLLGDRPYAVDLLWGIALMWCRQFNLIETTPAVDEYIERITSRPAFIRHLEIDKSLVEQQENAVQEA